MGLAEASLSLLINLTGLLSAFYLRDTMRKQGRRAMAVLLIFVMAAAASSSRATCSTCSSSSSSWPSPPAA